jgi:chemotaxis protein histidine kinase CheA
MDEAQNVMDFIEKTNTKLELISQNLLRHEKKPTDREFLNDIFKAIRSIRNDALHAGFGRISELSFHAAGLIDRICQGKLTPDEEIVGVITAARDRIAQLLQDIETGHMERTPVKDILDRIRAIEEKSGEATVTGSGQPPQKKGNEEEDDDLSLLPPDMFNGEYNRELDRELFHIFLDQTQENLSLLRALTNSYPDASNREQIIGLCSDLVSKLQISANYMGYQRLADFYLQWVAELEMMGVEMSVGGPVSFDFMDKNIQRIAALFPQIKDVPADPSLVEKTAAAAREEYRTESTTREDREAAAGASAKTRPDGGEEDKEAADADAEPLPARASQSRMTKKYSGPEAPVALNASFLDEEKRRNEFDEELYQIFIEHLQENLSQLRTLTDKYPQSRDKAKVINQCSSLVGKLQYSANYMGYEQLAEYYLQWIAELEMAGIDISLGKKIPIAFMNQRIGEIAGLFPEVKDIPAESLAEANQPGNIKAGPADEFPALDLEETDFPFSLKGLFSRLEEAEDDTFDENAAPVSALTAQGQTGAKEQMLAEAGGTFPVEAPRLGEFNEETGENISAGSMAEPEGEQPGMDTDTRLPDMEEDREHAAPPALDPSRSALLNKLSDALKSLNEEPAAGETAISLPEQEMPGEETDAGLYEQLLTALQSSAEDDAVRKSDQVDQVMEEILAASVSIPDNSALALGSPVVGPEPPDAREALGVGDGRVDARKNTVDELLANRSSLARLYREITGFDLDYRAEGTDGTVQLVSLNNLLSSLGDNGLAPDRVSSEIIAGLLKIRMMPVSRLFNLYKDFVAEQSGAGGKKIKLDILGDDTEIDQSLLKDMEKCLPPIISNAVIHGIEPPAERRLAGKNEVGLIRLAAHQDNQHLFVEIADDGRGIDPGKIKFAALAGNLYAEEELDGMSDDQLIDMIMSPGLSTGTDAAVADSQDGMHRVKTIIDKLNGTMRIKSTVGRGTSVRLRIPLRIPLFRALKFSAGPGSFVVPLSGVEEVLRLDAEQIVQEAEGEAIMLRGECIPVFPLDRFVHIPPAGPRGKQVYIVIISSGARKTGLIVDSIIGLEVVVIKPLAEFLMRRNGLSGAQFETADEISSIPDITDIMRHIDEDIVLETEYRDAAD